MLQLMTKILGLVKNGHLEEEILDQVLQGVEVLQDGCWYLYAGKGMVKGESDALIDLQVDRVTNIRVTRKLVLVDRDLQNLPTKLTRSD